MDDGILIFVGLGLGLWALVSASKGAATTPQTDPRQKFPPGVLVDESGNPLPPLTSGYDPVTHAWVWS